MSLCLMTSPADGCSYKNNNNFNNLQQQHQALELAARTVVNVSKDLASNSTVNVRPVGMDAFVRMKSTNATHRPAKTVACVWTNWPVMCVPVPWAIREQIAKKRS